MKLKSELSFFAIVFFAQVLRPDHAENGRVVLIGEDLSHPMTVGNLTVIGDRNAFHVLNGTSEEKIDWFCSSESKDKCTKVGDFDAQGKCENYVTILDLTGEGVATVLGTNAASPTLRTYQINEMGVTMLKEKQVKKATSFFPQQKSLFFEVNETVSFTAGFANLHGEAAQVCRNGEVCTPSKGLKVFTAPEFLRMIPKGNHVYTIYMDNITHLCQLCENIKQPHIMRVCANDSGPVTRDLTTFIITRLKCSLRDLHYTRLVAVSESFKTTCKGDKPCTAFAGVFLAELPTEKRYSAAVCLFDLEDIDQVLDRASFANLTGLPVDSEEIPEPRPGNCQVPNSPVSISFAKHHHQVLQSIEGLPVLSIEGYKITTLSIDHVTADNGTSDQILYFGTDDGSLLRYAFNKSAAQTFRKAQILPDKQEIRYLDWQNKEMVPPERGLIVSTKTQLMHLQPYQCCAEDAESCASCVSQQDPHCTWDDETKSCSIVSDPQEATSPQDLSTNNFKESTQDAPTPARDGCGCLPTSTTAETLLPEGNRTTPGVTQPELQGFDWTSFSLGMGLGFVLAVPLTVLGCYFIWKRCWNAAYYPVNSERGRKAEISRVQFRRLLNNPVNRL